MLINYLIRACDIDTVYYDLILIGKKR